MFHSKVTVESVRQSIMNREHMTSMSPRCFEHDYLMTLLHQLIGATHASKSSPAHDNLFRCFIFRGNKFLRCISNQWLDVQNRNTDASENRVFKKGSTLVS